ncbi:hypothetical protein quinque_016289 [Culex quinquefasciatus]
MAIVDQSVRWFRKLFSKSQAKDVFWLLDYLLILGGTYHRPRGVWRITIWYLYQLLSVFQCCLQILIVVSNLNSLQDQTSTIWSTISLLAMTLCYVKQLLLWRYRESINNLRTFITGSRFCSGNPSYDEALRTGAISYVIIRDEFSLCSVAVLTCMSISVLECYWWCHLVDTFQDVNETISRHLLSQCCQLPYSDDHHVDYVKMRISLLIIAGRSRQSVGFSCCGIFKISTAMFANLLNICYSVLMFLVNVGDGVKPVAQLQAWIGSVVDSGKNDFIQG